MTTPDSALPFTFSFRELAPMLEPSLSLVAPDGAGIASGGTDVDPTPRPRWLPRLLPVFRSAEPLLIEVSPAAGPAFGRRLLGGLAGLFAAAGAAAGVRVQAWDDRFAVGAHTFARLPREPHAVLVAADLDGVSIKAAAEALRAAGGRGWLVLDGAVPEVDAALGVQRAAACAGEGRVVRLPMLDRRDLRALRSGRRPALARRTTGEAYLALARDLVLAYLEPRP